MVAASLLFAVTMLALAFIRHVWLLNAFEFFTGFSWIAVLSTLNVGAQRSAARWVKARALAVYLTVFFGSMTVGSAIWGKLASEFGVAWSLCAATIGMVLGAPTVLRWRLEKDAALDLDILDPAGGTANITIPHERGPVMVSCEYRIDPQNAMNLPLLCRRCAASDVVLARWAGRCTKMRYSQVCLSKPG